MVTHGIARRALRGHAPARGASRGHVLARGAPRGTPRGVPGHGEFVKIDGVLKLVIDSMTNQAPRGSGRGRGGFQGHSRGAPRGTPRGWVDPSELYCKFGLNCYKENCKRIHPEGERRIVCSKWEDGGCDEGGDDACDGSCGFHHGWEDDE